MKEAIGLKVLSCHRPVSSMILVSVRSKIRIVHFLLKQKQSMLNFSLVKIIWPLTINLRYQLDNVRTSCVPLY